MTTTLHPPVFPQYETAYCHQTCPECHASGLVETIELVPNHPHFQCERCGSVITDLHIAQTPQTASVQLRLDTRFIFATSIGSAMRLRNALVALTEAITLFQQQSQ